MVAFNLSQYRLPTVTEVMVYTAQMYIDVELRDHFDKSKILEDTKKGFWKLGAASSEWVYNTDDLMYIELEHQLQYGS